MLFVNNKSSERYLLGYQILITTRSQFQGFLRIMCLETYPYHIMFRHENDIRKFQ